MILIQFTGLSGSGKTTLAENVRHLLLQNNYEAEIVDGDIYRQTICKDLGFSKEDRCENVRRLFNVGRSLIERDPKGLYRRALLPDNDQNKIRSFTGISDVFEIPKKADLVLKTDAETVSVSTNKLYNFILSNLNS